MTELLLALAYGTLAGSTIPLGGYLARIERLRPHWLEQEFRHSVIAFGGGVLIAAVALVLVPEGSTMLSMWAGILAFFLGGVLFALIDRWQKRLGGSHAQLLAMLADFVPEALALGALLASNAQGALVLTALIALQNLPESFNAWREMAATGIGRPQRRMGLFFALACVGPLAVLLGELLLAEMPAATGAIMLAAAGGILFLMFQDIAVQAHLKQRQAPSLAAVAGFAFGMLCQALAG